MSWTTLTEMCRDRVAAEPARKNFVFLSDGTNESDSLTLAELDLRARVIAVRLLELAKPGDRALLTYPAGLDFVSAFVGCLYANVIAVPIPPVDAGQSSAKQDRLAAIARSAAPALVLSTSGLLTDVRAGMRGTSELADTPVLATDEVDGDADDWREPDIDPDSVAYLQYSSGSTGMPKGVVLTHRNVLSNLELIHENGAREDDGQPAPPVVLWLPQFHDMGLINGLLQPIFAEYDATLMPPLTFVQRPFTWLNTISRLGRALSVAPNFAYDLCVRRISESQRQSLDLSQWGLAAVGAEPVRAETLDRFCEVFAESGFRREALFPCYGLAESTVMVSGGPASVGPVIRRFDTNALARGRVREVSGASGRALVGCGQIQPTTLVVLVNPTTGKICPDDEVGEIFVSADSVGTGYWNAPEQTEQTFHATLDDHPGRRFLRTGDLGFTYDDQLFVTGRQKEVIILDGLNYYPHDIEATVAGSRPAVRPGFCCAFSVDDGQRERLVVLAEMQRPPTPGDDGYAATIAGIRRAVTAEHGVTAHDIVPLRMGALPLTSSAKIQRVRCRERYQAGEFGDDTVPTA